MAGWVASAATEPRAGYGSVVLERDTQRLLRVGSPAIDPHHQRAATMGLALRPDARGVGHGPETTHLLLATATLD
ncbi:hypothetical protein [Streptomyces sp. NPDC101249]|uniref:hypothetical protein n=1 Tax=Streptomyces sp. NPDC101249 TaxID=3366140 RepID=UPI0037F868E6